MRAKVPGGRSTTKSSRDPFSGLFHPADLDGTLEAAFLLKQTGIAVAAWTRTPVPLDVMSVMAATMWGSLDTLVRTLGGEGPRSVLLEVEDRWILAMQIPPNWTLLLVAPRTTGRRRLSLEAQRIVKRVARLRDRTEGRPATVGVRE